MKRTLLHIPKVFCFVAMLMVLLFFSDMGYGQASQAFTANGTFTVPKGITSVKVECWDAGGGGPNNSTNASGGGGAYTAGTITGLSTGDATAITGGAAGSNGGISSATIGSSTITANAGSSVTTSRNGGAGGTASSIGGIIIFSFACATGKCLWCKFVVSLFLFFRLNTLGI